MAEAVVCCAPVAVLQDVIGLVDFLEFVLAFLVVGIAVGMKFLGELAIRAFDLFDRSGLLTTEDFVIAAFRHRLS
jgi:hypothetical protein